MQRKINFNAGPAELPAEVIHETSRAVRKYADTGLSILELPHRGKEFLDIVEESKQLVRELCGLNSDYEVLWLQGGGRMQFCMAPMNFLAGGKNPAGYIDSGHWAHEAMEYAQYYGTVKELASSKSINYSKLPEWPEKMQKLAYIHLTTNNTIYGTQWHNIPAGTTPLIADMSSDILSGKHDYKKYGMFYAAAQKNLGTPGVALVVIRKDFLEQAADNLPPMLSYKAHVKENSILNTANVSGVYVALLTLRWIKETGLAKIEKENARKAKLLYDTLDKSKVFIPHVKDKASRSLMNVCFATHTPEQEKAFLDLCDENDVIGIKGHRSVGGFRASLYNAIPESAVQRLVEIMKHFEGNS